MNMSPVNVILGYMTSLYICRLHEELPIDKVCSISFCWRLKGSFSFCGRSANQDLSQCTNIFIYTDLHVFVVSFASVDLYKLHHSYIVNPHITLRFIHEGMLLNSVEVVLYKTWWHMRWLELDIQVLGIEPELFKSLQVVNKEVSTFPHCSTLVGVKDFFFHRINEQAFK